jgi:hypothetical protein
MKKQVILVILSLLLLFPTILASDTTKTIDSEIQKLTYYAEQYEIGNIDYTQLMVHISSVREGLNEILGVTNREMGGIVKQDAIEKILGEPFEETKWVWVEGADHDTKLNYYVPLWKKIVFDGKKIQIRMEAFPSIFTKTKFDDHESSLNEIEEGALIYRLHFNIEFKRPQDQLDIEGKINEIKSLAETFNSKPIPPNAENLAKQSVNAERIFQNYFRQSQEKCEDLMKSIFGSENKRQSQKILSSEITFFEGEDFEAIIRLEMCDECEWNWINMHMWFESRGRFKRPKEQGLQNIRGLRQKFEQMTSEQIEEEAEKILNEIKNFLEVENYGKAIQSSQELNVLNNVWNEISNNVWEEVQQTFEDKINLMSEEERYEFDQNYGWIKQDQEQRKEVKIIQQQNYENRRAFYRNLFVDYYKKEFYVTETNFEKRLIEEFKEKGEEICNNNQDDNDNGQVDCEEAQCGGKICGTGTQTTSENTTTEIQVDFYCIQSICQAREEINDSAEPICGNHICEQGEADTTAGNGTCQSDCDFATCPTYDAIECSGKVIFEGEDENGCSLPPICIEETETCNITEDCAQPTCGITECMRIEPEDELGTCKVTGLTLCEVECESWEQEIRECNDGQKIITKICEDGQWQETGSECESPGCAKCGNGCVSEEDIQVMMCEETTEDFSCLKENGECIKQSIQEPTPVPTEPIVGHECVVANDCGGENDVCSNGNCVSIPEVIRPEEPEEEEEQEEEEEEPEEEVEQEEEPEEEEEQEEEEEPESTEPEETPDETGVFGFFKALLGKLTITGKTIDGEEESTPDSTETDSSSDTETDSSDSEPPIQEDDSNNEPEEDNEPNDYESYDESYNEDFKDDSDDWERRDREERERHEEEQRERCTEDCARPCIDRCTRESCGDEIDCNIEEEIRACEEECEASDDCIEKCTSGEEDWWKEFEEEDMHKEEKGVFQVGGGCRQERGKTEGHIWFNGWGDPFGEIQFLKEKYYSGGEADWCKHDLNNLIKQREEFEEGFNQEFAQWFFEKYLPGSAEEWEQAQSGIYELYWNSVDMQRQFAERMKCLDKNNIEDVMNINLINIEYETEFGKLEYWEEIKQVKMEWMDEKVTIISPYMKVWVFPSEEFIKYEMKKSMADGEFPGPPEKKAERENEDGLTDEEKENIKRNKKFMKQIKNIAEQYNGNANGVLQIMDGEEIIFNLYVQMNEEDIMKMEPMLPEEVPAKDITVKMDFKKLYDLINFEEREMRGADLESPPWDYRPRHGRIKGFTNGIKMYFKVRSLINSAEVIPESVEEDVKDIMKSLLKMMGDKEDRREEGMGAENKENKEEGSQENSGMTGKVIAPPFEF